MCFSPDDLECGLNLLLSSVGFTEANQGCQGCSVARDVVDANLIHYEETWASEAGFQRHVRSEEFRRVLLTMDMCCEEPQVTVGTLSGRRGIAYLQELCEGQSGGAD